MVINTLKTQSTLLGNIDGLNTRYVMHIYTIVRRERGLAPNDHKGLMTLDWI